MESDNSSRHSLHSSQSSGGTGHSSSHQFKFFKRHDLARDSSGPCIPTSNSTCTGDLHPSKISETEKNRTAYHALAPSLNSDAVHRDNHADSQRNRLILGLRSELRQRGDDLQLRSAQAREPSIIHSNPGFTLRGLFHSPSPVSEGVEPVTTTPSSAIAVPFSKSSRRKSGPAPQLASHAPSCSPVNEAIVSNRAHSTRPPFESLVYSRSASVVSSAFGRQDEDISSIMMRGATDLRNTKFEVEEQRREIAFLQSQLDSAKSEKDEALKRLKAVKDSAKKGFESSSKSLSGLQSVLNDLKAQSQTSFDAVTQARKSMPDVEELRNTIAEALKTMEPLVDENRQLVRTSKMKTIMRDLELQCTKSGQVADILRDRLQSVGAELIDAKGRIVELEGAQVSDRAALCSSAHDVTSATQRVTELADCLKQQQGDLYDILSAAADTEAKLAASTEQKAHLDQLMAEKQAELEALRCVQQHNVKLQSIIDDRNTRLVLFDEIKLQLATVQSELNDREGTIRALEATLSVKDESIIDWKARIAQAESSAQDSNAMVHKLRDDLRNCEGRERAALKDNECFLSENHALQEKVSGLATKLDELRREVESRGERLHQANARSQALEERFEDQSVTLRITRESNGDLQERLIVAETTHAQTLESSLGKLNCEIALLKEQKSHLQMQVDKAETDSQRKDDAAETMKTDYEGKLAQQDATFTARLDAEEKRAGRMERDLDASRARVQTLQDKLSTSTSEIQDLRDNWKEAKSLTTLRQAEVDTLKSQVQLLEAAREQSLERVKTIGIRYRTGDLVDEEKVFINALIHTSQAIHEKELVTKGNELRRRDNAIKELRSKVHLLESTLAKHLQSQTTSKTPVGVENQSMINPASWMSTDRSSSPIVPGAQAPDRDAPSTNVDNTVTAKPTPAPGRPPARVRPKTPASDQVTPAHAARASKVPLVPPALPKTPLAVPAPTGGPAPATSKPMFSRLATDASDDIIEFDDEAATRRLSPAVLLGKRDKMSSPPAAATPSILRPSKRLRAATRKHGERESETITSRKSVDQATTTKPRTRKRR